jgi:regulator of CtrA degradation
MGHQYEGPKRSFAATPPASPAIPFIHRLASSSAFKDLFREGMTLVEEAASYLDGPGREESRVLARPAALAYSTESMRLTTRLMQVASWLLLQRAVNEGELTSREAQAERVRVKLSREDCGCRPEIFEQLPPTLRDLSQRSMRIQERVMHLDRSLVVAHSREPVKARSEVASQFERLRAAFSQITGQEPFARPGS